MGVSGIHLPGICYKGLSLQLTGIKGFLELAVFRDLFAPWVLAGVSDLFALDVLGAFCVLGAFYALGAFC